MSTSYTVWWNHLLKKAARGANDEDLGNVQDVDQNHILTQRGMLNNEEKFYIPRYLVERYDDNVLWFRISKEEAKSSFMINSLP